METLKQAPFTAEKDYDEAAKSELTNLLKDLSQDEGLKSMADVERAFSAYLLQSPSAGDVPASKTQNCLAPSHASEEHRRATFSALKQILIAAYLWEGGYAFSNVDGEKILSDE